MEPGGHIVNMKSTVGLAVLLLSTGVVDAETINPGDSRINYVGRWDLTNSSAPWCAWQGSTISTRFAGSAISAEMESDRTEFIRVVIDGNTSASEKLELKPGRHKYGLTRNLEPGRHSIQIVKETYSGQGRLTLHGLDVVGDGLLGGERAEPRLRIQFYGDSNLAGYSLEDEKNRAGAAKSGCSFTYGGIVSRMLDAEYQNISSSGATILGRQNSVMSFYDRLDYHHSNPQWDFDRFPADICVVNIGANDINRHSKEQIKQNYKTLLQTLRKAHPSAHIVVMNGFGWSRDETANYTDEVVNEIGDRNMSRLVFPWLFNEWHGCEYDHAGMARSLTDHLANLNPQWKPVRPMDVMDGFGRNGDVANGSFEYAAPFGGFGWRYFEDGAVRIHAPGDSDDGEWFLRLPEGTQVHQPNPAAKDSTYVFRLKMRSPKGPGRARVRVEYRDQEWRNEIVGSAEEVPFEVGKQWKEFKVTSHSPAESSDPSRDPWQVIIRIVADSGTVDCDNIRLSSSHVDAGQSLGD